MDVMVVDPVDRSIEVRVVADTRPDSIYDCYALIACTHIQLTAIRIAGLPYLALWDEEPRTDAGYCEINGQLFVGKIVLAQTAATNRLDWVYPGLGPRQIEQYVTWAQR